MWLLDFFAGYYEAMYVPVDARDKERALMNAQAAREHETLVVKFSEAIESISGTVTQYEAQRTINLTNLKSLNHKLAEYELRMNRLLKANPRSPADERELAILRADYQIARQEYNCKLQTCKYMGSMVSLSCARLELLKKQLTTLSINDSNNELIKCGPLINTMVASMERTVRDQHDLVSAGIYSAINMDGDTVTADSVKHSLY